MPAHPFFVIARLDVLSKLSLGQNGGGRAEKLEVRWFIVPVPPD